MLYYSDGTQRRINGNFRLLFRIPYVRRFLRRRLTRTFLRRLAGTEHFDVCNVHYVKPEYARFAKDLRGVATRLVTTVWGSDFYLMDDKWRKRQKSIYEASDSIVFGNPKTRDEFVSYYKAFEVKTRVCSFGLKSLELIKKIQQTERRSQSRERIGIPADSFVICCGSNANKSQNHERILASLVEIREFLPVNVVVLLAMTYPSIDARYLAGIEEKLRQNKMRYHVISEFMTKEDTARIRISTDIMVNMQNTDQLSAAFQEHAYAGGIVVAGDWLPYDVFENAGVFMLKASFAGLGDTIKTVVQDWELYREKASANAKSVERLSSWESKAPAWKAIYAE